MESRIKGKIAIVTGATSGIGWSSAIELAKLGANVIISGRRQERLDALGKELDALGVKHYPLIMDVSKSADVKEKWPPCQKNGRILIFLSTMLVWLLAQKKCLKALWKTTM